MAEQITTADLDRMEAGLANVTHRMLPQAKCTCGFDAYRDVGGIMLDYRDEIQHHVDRYSRTPSYKPLSREDARALIAIAREHLARAEA